MSTACIVFGRTEEEALEDVTLYIDNRGSTSYLISDLSQAWSDLAPLDLSERSNLVLKVASWYMENRTTVNIKLVDSMFDAAADGATNWIQLDFETPDEQGRPTAIRVQCPKGYEYPVEWE